MKKWILSLSVLLILAGLLTYQMFSLAKVECSLCISFQGTQQCSTALGPDEAQAQEEAHRHACASVTSGVTESVNCTHAPRRDIVCRNQ